MSSTTAESSYAGPTGSGITPNAMRLLWAGFMAILAAGVGFAIRNGILDNWGKEYNFTAAQLGAIGGAGFSGFCFGIILGGVIVDKIGYGKLVILAFVLHVLSAFVTFGATGPDNAYNMLFWGMFIFSYANGTLEAVANPLVATLFPQNRTHYLNILHASWPAGMIIGTVLGWILDDKMELGWKTQLSLYLLPTVLYGVMFLGQKMPKSEASAKGVKMGEMFKDVGILGGLVICALLALFFSDILKGIMTPKDATPERAAEIAANAKNIGYAIGGACLLVVAVITKFSFGSLLMFVLFITHLLVGAVELGTDGWIQNITGNLFSSEQGKWLFIWTSVIMFSLRFCAHWIEKTLKLSPIGLLFICAVLACVGLQLSSMMTSFTIALLALGVYAVGKTFFWPTMLAVASDRYPRSGAVAISIMGGIGMLSAGLIGGPGLGYCKDRFSGEELAARNPATFAEYKAAKPSMFLNIESTAATGLDGAKFGAIGDKLKAARAEIEKAGGDVATASEKLTPAEREVHEAGIAGDRKTLKTDSFIPLTMAVIYLLIFFYFKSIGGYKAVKIEEQNA
ncbi:MAG TPA: MFS transporter [Verrucomicrobiales bacterium]|jgi:MFS family permease|nr:MFS transporter [Verrucomicrobiales bacterium]